MTKRKGKKVVNILAIIIIFILLLYFGVLGYFRLPVKDYYKASEKTFIIPDLNDNFVPQGFCYDEQTDEFLISGYNSKNAPSPIFSVNKSTNEKIKKVNLYKDESMPWTGHGGGIAINGDFLYLMDDTGLMIYSYDDFKNAENDGKIVSLGRFSTELDDGEFLRVDFVSVIGNKLYIGEFHYAGKYDTPESHRTATADGENKAYIFQYALNDDSEWGFNKVPNMAFSVTDKVQGMTIDNGKIYLSCSYGLAFSNIFVHDLKSIEFSKNIKFGENSLPLYILDSQNLIGTIKAPPMSEEIVILDNQLYTMCESACNKYFFGKLTGARWCYKTDLTKYFAN